VSETSAESANEESFSAVQEAARVYENGEERHHALQRDDASEANAPLDAATTIPSTLPAMPDNSAVRASETAAPLEGTENDGAPTQLDSQNPREPLPQEVTSSWPSSQPPAFPPSHRNLQNNLRLRMKVWTDPRTFKRYLMPLGFMKDLVNGQPVTDVMYSYALSDNETKIVALTAVEWNSLPFFYFQEDGHAPRGTV